MSNTDFLHVAVIIGAHGVKGELKALVLSEHPDRLQELSELSLLTAGGLFVRRVKISARKAHGHDIVKIDDLDDRDEAQALKGCYLSVTREEAAPLPEGRFYIRDLIGLKVVDEQRGEIGYLRAVSDNNAQDIYEIKRPELKPLFLAVSKETFINADLEKKEIHVKLPEGLWEVYD